MPSAPWIRTHHSHGTPSWSQDVDVAAAAPVSPASGTKNLMYTLHFYACTHQQELRDKANAALTLGLALFVTEFGATPRTAGSFPRATPTCAEIRRTSGGTGCR